MVKVETRIQLAIKEILEEETWKHLKTNNNFDKVLSIASLIEPFDEGPDACYEDCKGMCFYHINKEHGYKLESIIQINKFKYRL